jgi:hypothetical protein
MWSLFYVFVVGLTSLGFQEEDEGMREKAFLLLGWMYGSISECTLPLFINFHRRGIFYMDPPLQYRKWGSSISWKEVRGQTRGYQQFHSSVEAIPLKKEICPYKDIRGTQGPAQNELEEGPGK